jgi:hypothetical protein
VETPFPRITGKHRRGNKKMTQIGIEQENKEIEEIQNENEYPTTDDVKNTIKKLKVTDCLYQITQ